MKMSEKSRVNTKNREGATKKKKWNEENEIER